MSLSLQKLNLTHFRSYEALRLDIGAAHIIVLTGANGAGKTNILEAVSLIAPGRGLRGAEISDIKNALAAPEDLWAVSAEIESIKGDVLRIGTGQDREGKRRILRIDGKDAKSQNELANISAAVWLTPQMDRIFLEGASARRKFFDRLVFAHAPDHTYHLNRYERAMRERMALLKMDKPADPRWFDQLESQMAADGVAIAMARRHLTDRLHHHVKKDSSFPAPALDIKGMTDDHLLRQPALAVEEMLQRTLKNNRPLDAEAGKTLEGPHRSDFIVRYAEKNMPADQCSTGEQKGLLISLVLAHARLMQSEKGFVPLLLLDEVAAHLDEGRREELFADLLTLSGQIWLTGTEESIFSTFHGKNARFFHVSDGCVLSGTLHPPGASPLDGGVLTDRPSR